MTSLTMAGLTGVMAGGWFTAEGLWAFGGGVARGAGCCGALCADVCKSCGRRGAMVG